MDWGDPRIEDGFWRRTCPCPISGCWLWSGHVASGGRPTLLVVVEDARGARTANRGARWVALGQPSLSAGEVVVARCGVALCVRTDHMIVTSRRDRLFAGDVRSVSGAVIQADRCVAGHALSGDNVRIDRRGWRRCVLCAREWGRRSDARRRAPDRATIAAAAVLR